MELRIISPQENGFVREIQWNHEELKTEIAEKMQEYKTLTFTEDSIKEAKADRAKLNKLKSAFDDERKRIKKLCMAPYDTFEKQVKELIALIDEPIQLIDAQIKEVEQLKRDEKRKAIEELFSGIGFQAFVTLEAIWDEKWLNATVSMGKIEEQMKSRMYQIADEVYTIHNLPEFSFESMEVYKNTLDLNKAIQEGKRLSEIQKRKIAYEEEQRRKQEESQKAIPESCEEQQQEKAEEKDQTSMDQADEILHLDFRVWGTRDQLLALRNYMNENHLKFGKVE